MSVYLLINIFIIIIPLIMSFEKKIRFIKKLPAVFLTLFTVGIFFIAWDINATEKGDWSFNPEFVSGLKIAGLPYEEILFFITVPYSILFIYESLRHYLNERTYDINRMLLLTGMIIFATASYYFIDLNYTSNVMTAMLIVLLVALLSGRTFGITNVLLITLLVSFIPFIIVNYFLTSLPVLIYNPVAITGIRFITIPVEDFFYSFSMISAWLMVYSLLIKSKLLNK
ncbi:MAG: lycopene cyclase domain-containing protein [Ignavibacteria bacterium]|nr:lycopene cyclase domain-containing protein [Ignavibacteria bacterium]